MSSVLVSLPAYSICTNLAICFPLATHYGLRILHGVGLFFIYPLPFLFYWGRAGKTGKRGKHCLNKTRLKPKQGFII